jgi:hypothetical protein
MKTCWDCSTALDPTAAFCSNCGRQVRSKGGNVPRNEGLSQLRKGQEDALKKQSKDELVALKERIIQAARARNRSLLPLLAGLVCFLLGAYFVNGGWGNLYVIIPGVSAFALMLDMAHHNGQRWLYQAEYYSIAGSRDNDGKHRCISCGHKGIYVQGQYRTNAKFSSCSKCKKPLFVQ